MSRLFLILGAFSAALGVAAGAFGAHALRARVEPQLLDVFETGARYQMYHAFALIAVAWVIARNGGAGSARSSGVAPIADALSTLSSTLPAAPPGTGFALASGWLFVAGTVFFSGSLYAMTFTGIRALGAITPIGGVCFIAGWVCLAAAAWTD